MKYFIFSKAFVLSLLLSPSAVTASPDVNLMSDIEVSQYAVRMSDLLDKIQKEQICHSDNLPCLRVEFTRNGLSYDDKESVKKRVFILVGSIR